MNQVALQRQIDELTKELKYAGENTDRRLTELKADIDQVKLDVAALIKFIKSNIDGFDEQFKEIREQTAREINPELLEKGTKI